MVGAMILCKSGLSSIRRSGSSLKMPFLMAILVDCVPTDPDVIVQYWVPPVAPVSRTGGGKKNMVVDLFGDWGPLGHADDFRSRARGLPRHHRAEG